MRAIRVTTFGGPENLKLESDLPIPSVGKKEVLLKVSAAGVNPVDTYIRNGTYARLPTLPYTPGSDAAGIVEEVGAEARPGQTCLIHGASGAVGLAAVQLAKAMGLRVIGTAGTKEGMDLVKETGADLVFNHRQDGYVKDIQDAVGGADIILEMLSNVNLQKDLDLVNAKGKVMIIGCRGPIEINPRSTMGKESCIMGVNLMSASDEEFKEMHCMLSAGMKVGWLEPKVSTVYPLGEAKTAHHDVINNQGTQGKLILDTTK
ncbi:quinone oxidoreductase [Elysia marginata]|uniref:Quinone oxidoreductase n=1 Tax=Elysia marginata TaxID=1093978 RepID=A0AAV4FE41_9GAST|nr:quinone oxidoreductase [Elysia marginata]